MNDSVGQARERLVELIVEAAVEAMTKVGFAPSERFIEKMNDEVRWSLKIS